MSDSEERSPRSPLRDRVLISLGVPHGFGQKGSEVPENTQFPKQVHGIEVCEFRARGPITDSSEVPAADAVWTRRPGASVGIVTADCVPILVSDEAGESVAAIHAGWRGLAAGVIEAGVRSLQKPGEALVAAVGPAARACCYEVDHPVRNALDRRYRAHLEHVFESGRSEHFQLDLPLLARRVLEDLGILADRIGTDQMLCTVCHADQFDSYRRDGAAAGRLRHFIGAGRVGSIG